MHLAVKILICNDFRSISNKYIFTLFTIKHNNVGFTSVMVCLYHKSWMHLGTNSLWTMTIPIWTRLLLLQLYQRECQETEPLTGYTCLKSHKSLNHYIYTLYFLEYRNKSPVFNHLKRAVKYTSHISNKQKVHN